MPLETTSGLGVQLHYGPRNVRNDFGGRIEQGLKKTVVIDINVPKGEGIALNAWAKTGLDHVFPTGVIFLSANLIVETAFDGADTFQSGTYLASDGTTAVSAAGLFTTARANVDAVGDRVVGAGVQLATGTAGLGATTAPTVVRTTWVVGAGTTPTAGKARLVIEYLAPTP